MKPSCTSFLLCITFIFSVSLLKGQTRCQTDLHQLELLENSDYKKWYNGIQKVARNQSAQRSVDCSSPFVIPIAVHYSGDIDNSNTTCLIDKALEQIAVLNADFSASNSDLSNYCLLYDACCSTYPADVLSKGTCLQFCLASANHPSCEPSGNLIGGYAITIGQHTWPLASNNCWSGYLNIFVETGTGGLGVAPVGGGASPVGNGIQIESFAFGGPTGGCTSGGPIGVGGTCNLGRTLTHEVGHYFGLDHIFDGCGVGDAMGDTPTQDEENFGCPQVNATTCISTANNSCGTQDFFFNFMDYVNDACMFMFTRDQSQYMYNVAQLAGTGTNVAYVNNATVCNTSQQPAYSPLYPNGCVISSAVPESGILPASSAQDVCDNRTLEFSDASLGCDIDAWTWTFAGAGVNPTSSTLQNPSVTVSSSGTLTANLVTSNPTGPDVTAAMESYTINIIDSQDADCNECNDGFYDSGSWIGDYDNNEDIVTTVCAATGFSATVNFASFNVEFESTCQYDRLELFDGNSMSATYLGAFCGNGIASAPGGGTVSSTNSCLTFRFRSDVSVVESVWEGAVVCATTVPLELVLFSATLKQDAVHIQWKTSNEINIDRFILERSSNGSTFKAITSINPNGDAHSNRYAFIDTEIEAGQVYHYRLKNVDDDGSFELSEIIEIQTAEDKPAFQLFPNPNNGSFYLRSDKVITNSQIEVIDHLGKRVKILTNLPNTNEIKIEMGSLMNGIYYLRIIENGNPIYLPLAIVR